jgi:MFS family permease
MQTDQILPLLDGLDEVPREARMACVQAIGTYRREHLVYLVVCSRQAEYEEIERSQRLELHNAVVVQPLTPKQVETYLQRAGSSLASVREALQTNAVLQELTTTPLMLSILTLAYMGARVQDLPQQGSAGVQQQHIFATYIERMVERKGDGERYPLAYTKAWLSWLAQQMWIHNQTIFFLEHLQPDWLAQGQRSFYRWSVGLGIGLSMGLGCWLVGGLVGGLLIGLLAGLTYGLPFGRSARIEPVEALTWSWKGGDARPVFFGLNRRPVFGLLAGLFIGLLAGLYFGLVIGLLVGLYFGLVFALLGGLSKNLLTDRLHLSPNEGMRRSLKNGLFYALVGALGVGPFAGLEVGLLCGRFNGLLVGLLCGLSTVFLGGMFYGLGAVIQHVALRIWLWQTKMFPWQAVRFLDDATTRILLQLRASTHPRLPCISGQQARGTFGASSG